ncbi:pyridoxal phosphate-dependent aminotransferase [Agrilactobacillus fermenti]|uniref:pyridoxal phosphate-dependent aminotransferase n=1 Tax=Agrilactobacillus fermenti TaxID=2586909 RepID=UPI001E543337|nr:pyridoxal phosphate-dependent aminotransferase [Agrilactobacillus fermenti]MCD2257250.1 pyridoxal phosphate-dependent aminotransferase [Agrilactobacillus fermenti]
MENERQINQQVTKIAVSGIRQFDEAVSKIPDILKLTLGEPDFNTPAHIKQAAIQAINDNYSHYTGMAGLLELRQAASTYFEKLYGLKYAAEDEILVTVGATEAIATAITTVTNPGDAVLVPTPIFPAYLPLITLNHAQPIFIDTSKNGFVLTPEMIKAAIASHPDAHITAIILNYPSNPTGVTYDQNEITAMAKVLKTANLWVISDEIYSSLTFDHDHFSIANILRDQTILINGLSKSHAMTGWRIGFLLAPRVITDQLKKVHQYYVTAATTISQKAAVEALTNGYEDTQTMKAEYIKRRNYCLAEIKKLGYEVARPDGAFYLFIKLPNWFKGSAQEFTYQLAQESKLALISGEGFGPGGERYFRLSYAASLADLKKAMTRLGEFTQNHATSKL